MAFIPSWQVSRDSFAKLLGAIAFRLARRVGLECWLKLTALHANRLRQRPRNFVHVSGDLARDFESFDIHSSLGNALGDETAFPQPAFPRMGRQRPSLRRPAAPQRFLEPDRT